MGARGPPTDKGVVKGVELIGNVENEWHQRLHIEGES